MTIEIVAWYFSVVVVVADPQHSWLPHRYGPFESKAACEAERAKLHERAPKMADGTSTLLDLPGWSGCVEVVSPLPASIMRIRR
jgi:hypothetical protein